MDQSNKPVDASGHGSRHFVFVSFVNPFDSQAH